MQEIELSQLQEIAQVIKDKYDFDFSNYAMSSFRRRIQRLIEVYKYSSLDILKEQLETGNDKFFQDFLSEITVNVTEMFRDPSFWKELKESIFPNIFMHERPIDIWHAGCSSGEEVYSMTILLEEMGKLDQVNIVASDVDMAIIQKAKDGMYPIKNMELNQKNYELFEGDFSLDKYYQVEGNKAVMNSDLVKNVNWQVHDLVKGEVFQTFDLILCRNVMIYFNQNLQNEVLKKFHESLHKFSYLVVGSKESLIWCEISNKFITVSNEEKIYKKIRD